MEAEKWVAKADTCMNKGKNIFSELENAPF